MSSPFPDPVGAFVPHGKLTRPGHDSGPLAGLSVAVKDLFDWAGVPTGAGNPTWLATHPVPEADASALAALWNAGATLVGKTVTDELAYSIHGDNVHYGTPVNPASPERVPGGSSSGSASAVAAGLVEAALGTDTGGSIRVPAAYCGLYGLRTTHGLVDRSGVVELAPSFDTVGWLARDGATIEALAQVLLPELSEEWGWTNAWTLGDAFQGDGPLTDEATENALGRVLGRLGLTEGCLGLGTPFTDLERLRRTYATIQGWEAWQTHGPWITAHHPEFAPAVARRFVVASQVTANQVNDAREFAAEFRTALRAALGPGVLVIPATVGPAPLKDAPEAEVDETRARTMRLTCLAGLAGLPQITLPFRGADGLSRGVGLLGPAGSDRALARLASRLGGA